MTTTDRTRSFWGWGLANRFPDTQARAQMGQMVGALLGAAVGAPRPAPQLDAINLPETSVAIPEALASICTTDRYERALHTYGRAYPDIVRGFYGEFEAAPDVVALPQTEADVADLLDWCSRERFAAVPYGGGSSVVRGVEADRSGTDLRAVVCIDMRKLDAVLDVDETSLLARIQAGIMGPALEQKLAAHGLTLRHYPQSFEFSTLGGWIATRSGGHFATVYTHIDDFVAGMRMVTPAGTMETSTLPASGAGPDPNRLAMGSEGTLGIITEATMRVRRRPTWRARVSVSFADWSQAVAATRTLAQSDLHPTNCRLLDAREAMLHSVSFDGRHVLLLGFESAHVERSTSMAQALEICRAHQGKPMGEVKVRQGSSQAVGSGDAAANWRRAFIDAPYLSNTMVSLGVVADTFETACTWSAFEALHKDVIQSVRKAMESACGHKGRVSCRFTHVYPDGPAPYYTFLAPGRPGDEFSQWTEIKAAASEALLRHGATITHHHAVGRTHKPWYQRQTPDLFLDAMRATKAHFDPHGILNPGVLL